MKALDDYDLATLQEIAKGWNSSEDEAAGELSVALVEGLSLDAGDRAALAVVLLRFRSATATCKACGCARLGHDRSARCRGFE